MCWRTHSKPYPSLWRRIQRKSEVGRNSSWNAKFSGCFLAVVGNTPLQCRLEFRDSASGSLRKLTSLRRVLTRKFKLTEPQIQEEQCGFHSAPLHGNWSVHLSCTLHVFGNLKKVYISVPWCVLEGYGPLEPYEPRQELVAVPVI